MGPRGCGSAAIVKATINRRSLASLISVKARNKFAAPTLQIRPNISGSSLFVFVAGKEKTGFHPERMRDANEPAGADAI
jgi:hypothetical protein